MTKKIKDETYEIIELLTELGMARNPAKVLITMLKNPVMTAREIELNAEIRQPEVSITMKELLANAWVTESEEKKPGKGRPNKKYQLKVTLEDIINSLEINVAKKNAAFETAIKRLKELATKNPDVPAKE